MNIYSVNIKPTQILLALFLILNTFSASAGIYKWTDHNGEIHFSDKPKDRSSTRIIIKNTPSKSEIIEAKNIAQKMIKQHRSVMSIMAKEEQVKTLEENATTIKHAQNTRVCDHSQKRAISLAKGLRTYVTTESGERRFLSDSEKESKIAKLNQKMKRLCSFS